MSHGALAIMTGSEKAALLLSQLAPEVGELVLRQVGPEQGKKLRLHLRLLEQNPSPPDMVDHVLEEFTELLEQRSTPPQEQDSQSREPGEKPETGKMIQSQCSSAGPGHPDPVAELCSLDIQALALVVQEEQPRTVALVLEWLPTERATAILKKLPLELRGAVSVQLTRGTEVESTLKLRIAQALLDKARIQQQRSAIGEGEIRLRKMGEMLRLLDVAERSEILSALERHDQAAARLLWAHLDRAGQATGEGTAAVGESSA